MALRANASRRPVRGQPLELRRPERQEERRICFARFLDLRDREAAPDDRVEEAREWQVVDADARPDLRAARVGGESMPSGVSIAGAEDCRGPFDRRGGFARDERRREARVDAEIDECSTGAKDAARLGERPATSSRSVCVRTEMTASNSPSANGRA